MQAERRLKRVLIMAGGTGGHVFPGLAVADYLRGQGVEVQWMGTSQGLEARVVPAAGMTLHEVAVSGLRGKGLKTLLAAPVKMIKAVVQSMRIIKQVNPDVVIGMGGFVSGPGGLASWLLRKPLVIHEQNAKAGMTNKILAKFAKRVLEGFPTAFKLQPKVLAVGNPVRSDIESLPTPEQRAVSNHAPLRLLVLGGSLGAQALNELVPQALSQLASSERPQVLHQAGSKHIDAAKKAYESTGLQANVTPFIEDMSAAYAWADLVICRAGALTVAELCAVGLGAVFVPFPHAVDDHQTANASFMVDHQAALCVQQAALTDGKLAEIVRGFARAPEKCLAMAHAAYGLRKVRVTEKIFDILVEVAG